MYKQAKPLQAISLILSLSILISIPSELLAQKGSAKNLKEIHIIVSCTEYIGNGTLRVHFGYDNQNKKTIALSEDNSIVVYNHGQSKKAGLTIFEPGIVEKAFSEDFNYKDRVEWTVTLPNGKVKTVDANISSNHCRGLEEEPEGLPIIPYYAPPEGGKTNDSKIGAELTSLYNYYIQDPVSFDGVTDHIFRLDGDKVYIEVVALTGQLPVLLSDLQVLGFDLQDQGAGHATGWIGIAELLLLNNLAPLEYARPVYPGISNYTAVVTGLTQTQGDRAMRADYARLGFGVDGQGVKVGVLSNSYNTLDRAGEDIGNGDLPGAGNPNGHLQEVEVLLDMDHLPGTLSDEGRAMLQIVHDVAPGADLAFRTGYLGEQDMANGILELAAVGCDVIVDDITYITEPFFRDGVISRTIDQVAADGIAFFSSAGNFGTASHTGSFAPLPSPASISGETHDFGSGDIFQNIDLEPGTYTMVLQWDDGSDPLMETTQTDLDLYLSDDAAFNLLGFNRENVGGFPIEVIPFSVESETVNTNIIIARASGPAVPVSFKYIVFRGGHSFHINEYQEGNSTIVGHPNARGAIAVGAVRYDKNPVYSPDSYTKPVLMSFSSRGGTPVNGVVRSKPDISAPNGVNTTVDLGSGDWDGDADAYPNFFGTSAASPHAAALAALLIEARRTFHPGDPLGPEEIRTLLKSTAMDMGETGEDLQSGAGFIRADLALLSFANPSPVLLGLITDPEAPEPGSSQDSISFLVSGDFFTGDTEVHFRGDALVEGVNLDSENNISVDHSGFLGNPLLQVYNPSVSPSGLDGGFSEDAYFSDPVPMKVLIKTQSATRKYGESDPGFSAQVELITHENDTLSLEEALSLDLVTPDEAVRLGGHTFLLAADVTSDAGEYLLRTSLDPPLNEADPGTELDQSIVEKYLLEYINSSLLVEKLDLRITPVDMHLEYGQVFPEDGIAFHYELSDSTALLEDPGLLLASIENEHRSALSNQVGLARGIALVNGIPVIRGTALVNGVKLVRGLALVNGTEVEVEVTGSDTLVYIDGIAVTSGISLARGIALVNGLPFVNMTQISRGIALVNGNEIELEDGYMIALNGTALTNRVPAARGIALVNGEALINGYQVVAEGGVTTLDGVEVDASSIIQLNGITFVRGTALVNSWSVSRGIALVNELEIAIENGMPAVRGLALVNGIALVNGSVSMDALEIDVEDGRVSEVRESGQVLNGIALVNGLGFARGIALVNGSDLHRGLALVNGIALVNDATYSDSFVDLEGMNFMASSSALVNGGAFHRGLALVNGVESIGTTSLETAAGTTREDGSVNYGETFIENGIALVNAFALSRGIALVNGVNLSRGIALVNGEEAESGTDGGRILVFDATEVSEDTARVVMSPVSFITGTRAGRHWIVPGTFVSRNYELSYGLGTLMIDQAPLEVKAANASKVYGDPDPELSYTAATLFAEDSISGQLLRESGEDASTYQVLRGSLSASEDYWLNFKTGSFHIHKKEVWISPLASPYNISEGDSLPDITFVYDGWIEGDEGKGDFTVLRDTDAVPYDPYSRYSAGSYELTPVPLNPNYLYYIEQGLLYVAEGCFTNDINDGDRGDDAGSKNDCDEVDDINDEKATKSARADSNTGMDEAAFPRLSAYPNPVRDLLTLELTDSESRHQIELYDLSGRSLELKIIEMGKYRMVLDLNHLEPGNYFIRVMTINGPEMLPLIRQ